MATPGTLRGYLHVHRRLGRLPLREVLAPAVHLARAGVAVTNFAVGQPSLDEVFLALTGRPADDDTGENAA